ncbi:MAG: hypothetical protein ABSB26_01515 [Nitrososphaerales archaeon]|jgi:hypothetical protein
MRTTIRLSIKCNDVNVCHQLVSVLKPDNDGVPRGMTLRMRVKEGTLQFLIASDSQSGAISTAIAVLRDVLLFQEVWLLSRVRDT